MKETLIDELRRIIAKADRSIVPELGHVIQRLEEDNMAIRLQALHLAQAFQFDSPSTMIAHAKEFEEYLLA